MPKRMPLFLHNFIVLKRCKKNNLHGDLSNYIKSMCKIEKSPAPFLKHKFIGLLWIHSTSSSLSRFLLNCPRGTDCFVKLPKQLKNGNSSYMRLRDGLKKHVIKKEKYVDTFKICFPCCFFLFCFVLFCSVMGCILKQPSTLMISRNLGF